MPPLFVAAAAAGVASVAAAAIAGTVITLATFVVPAAISLGVGLIARHFAPKPPGVSAKSTGRDVGSNNRLTAPITPAQWIVGRARTAGKLIYVYDTGRNGLFLVFAVSEGNCERIDRVYIDGQAKTWSSATGSNGLRRLTFVDTVPIVDLSTTINPGWTASSEERTVMYVQEFFSANGTAGEYIKARLDYLKTFYDSVPFDVTQQEWTNDMKGRGTSFVLVELYQQRMWSGESPPDNPSEHQVPETGYWSRIPNIEFVILGNKVSAPISDTADDTPAWTQNAAIIRAWWMVHRRGVPRSKIDRTYLQAAISKCGEWISYTGLPNQSVVGITGTFRYTINGIIVSGDDIESVEEMMDFCWNGAAVLWDGKYLFRPGSDRSSTHTITQDDIIEEPKLFPAKEFAASRYKLELNQIRPKQHLPYTLQYDDDDKQDEFPEIKVVSLGNNAYANDIGTARNNLINIIRQEVDSMILELVVRPGDNFANVDIIPGDKITVTIPDLYIDGQAFMVASNTILPGWAVALRLIEWGDDWFADDIAFPADV